MSDSSILGIKPNQAPRNSMLGECAYMEVEEIKSIVAIQLTAALTTLNERIAALEAAASTGSP